MNKVWICSRYPAAVFRYVKNYAVLWTVYVRGCRRYLFKRLVIICRNGGLNSTPNRYNHDFPRLMDKWYLIFNGKSNLLPIVWRQVLSFIVAAVKVIEVLASASESFEASGMPLQRFQKRSGTSIRCISRILKCMSKKALSALTGLSARFLSVWMRCNSKATKRRKVTSRL